MYSLHGKNRLPILVDISANQVRFATLLYLLQDLLYRSQEDAKQSKCNCSVNPTLNSQNLSGSLTLCLHIGIFIDLLID